MVDNFSIFIFWVDCISRLKSKTTFLCFKEKNSLLKAKIFPETVSTNKQQQQRNHKFSETPKVQQVICAGLTTCPTARSSLDTLHMSAHSEVPGWPCFPINFMLWHPKDWTPSKGLG